MRSLIVTVLLSLLPCLVSGQFIAGGEYDQAPADTNYWQFTPNVLEGVNTPGLAGHYFINSNASTDTAYINYSYIADPVFMGSGALQLDYSVQNAETWGGFAKISHWHPDTGAVYNLTGYDSISVMYNILQKQTLPGRVTFRLCLHDVSDAVNGANTYSNTECEYYYSFNYILDDEPGWHEIKIPLISISDGSNTTSGQFNLTGWAGISGNGILDLDKIKGYTYEFSISGSGSRDYSEGTIVLDNLMLKGVAKINLVFFNGKAIPTDMSPFAWNGSLEVEEGAGATENTNAMKWVQGVGQAWTGAGFDFSGPKNLTRTWKEDSVQLKMKAEAGTGKLRLQFEDGSAPHLGLNFDPVSDGAWHDYKFALRDFVFFDGSGSFDTSNVTIFQWMAEGTGSGKTIYIDDMWTGNPEIDVLPPFQVSGVEVYAFNFFNLISWQDVPGESGEVYHVYASTAPIADVTAPGVELIAKAVPEDLQQANHWLYYPLKTVEVAYYYAVECSDAAGNVGPASISSIFTNTARGLPTISLEVPQDFSADGDLNEWYSSGIMPFVLKPETDHVPAGSVTDSTDLKGTVFLAIDDNNLYLAADVFDDSYAFGAGNWWDQDALQIFIGLYNQTGPPHSTYKRGSEPDYGLYFNEQGFTRDTPQGKRIYEPTDENYYFEDLGGVDYILEAKIPLDSLAISGDSRFHPVRGMKIPLDIYFHDKDGTAWEGNLGLSRLSTDNQWQFPNEWLFTWIGDTNQVVSIKDMDRNTVLTYQLEQNYPNPFNPTTTIGYTIPKSGKVELKIFNLLGQNVAILVNQYQNPGTYKVAFSGFDLPSGIYFYSIKSAGFFETKKMILIK